MVSNELLGWGLNMFYRSNLDLSYSRGTKIQIDKLQWKQMANQMGSYLPKSGHSTTQTEYLFEVENDWHEGNIFVKRW